MGPIDDFEVLGGARHMGPVPKATVTGVKVSNGYVVSIWTPPKPEPPPPPPKEDGMTDDERLDHIVDALAAFIGFINNKGAGEDWKDVESREKIRVGFKAAFPQVAARPMLHRPRAERPAETQHVFGTQEEMLKFLKENF